MKEYKVMKQPLFLSSGTVMLSEKQYIPRKRNLKITTKKNVYDVIGEICFKSGEKVGLESKLVKNIIKSKLVERCNDTKRSNN